VCCGNRRIDDPSTEVPDLPMLIAGELVEAADWVRPKLGGAEPVCTVLARTVAAAGQDAVVSVVPELRPALLNLAKDDGERRPG
jgi:hypothetical protein